MLNAASGELFALVAIGLVIGLVVLLALQIITSLRVQRLTYPLYEYAQSRAQTEVDRILNEAKQQAHKIIEDAQSNASALVEKQRADIEAHSRDYQKALETLSQSAQQSIAEGVEQARTESGQVFKGLESAVAAQGDGVKQGIARVAQGIEALSQIASSQAQQLQQTLEAQGKQASGDLSHAFEEMATQGRKRIDEQISNFSKQAEAEVAAYRDGRKKIVDLHMNQLVIDATKLVLQKALTQEEHAQLVQRALKEAREAGIL